VNENRLVNNPVVSVCTITYNHEKYIRECLDGILMQQTEFPFELIIHDDASTDRTSEIVREYAEKFPETVVAIYQSENQYSKGVKITSTFVWPKVRGRYIAFCEGDDFWTSPHKLQKQVDLLEEEPECAACVHNGRIYRDDQKTGRFYWNSPKPEVQNLDEVFRNTPMLTASMLIRRSCTFPEVIPDWFLHELGGAVEMYVFKALESGYLRCMNEVMCGYRTHLGGVHSLLPREEKLRQGIAGRQVMQKHAYPDSLGLKLKIEEMAKELMTVFFETGRNEEAEEYRDLLLSRRARFMYQIPQWSPGLFRVLRNVYMKRLKKV